MMSYVTKALCATGLVGFVLGAAAQPAFAQQSAPKGPAPKAAAPAAPQQPAGIKVPLKAAPEQNQWMKVCGDDPTVNKSVCYTTRDFVAENNQPVMSVAVYATKDDSTRLVRFLVPLTFMIQPGIRFSVDGGSAMNARYQICSMEGCFVQGDLNDAAIAQFKKGTTMRIDMQNQIGQEVNFEVPMADFAKAFDGAGIDQETLNKMREQAARGQAPGAAPTAGADDLKKLGQDRLKARDAAPKQ